MNPDDKEVALRYLDQLDCSNIRAPDLPSDLWHAIAKLVPMIAVEIILADGVGRVLMVERDDSFWSGWHIPGGYLAYGETLAECCARTAKRELGIDIELEAVFDSFTWPEHPYGHTTSMLCACTSDREPSIGMYHSRVPERLATPHHRDFVKRYRRWRRNALKLRSVRGQGNGDGI